MGAVPSWLIDRVQHGFLMSRFGDIVGVSDGLERYLQDVSLDRKVSPAAVRPPVESGDRSGHAVVLTAVHAAIVSVGDESTFSPPTSFASRCIGIGLYLPLNDA